MQQHSLTPRAHPPFRVDPAPEALFVQARLGNGLDVIVVPNDRAPIASHMVIYKCGSADDPVGASGVAHFLEHLMFKGTHTQPAGRFLETVAALGGRQNAMTSRDMTAYFQRVPNRHLDACMDFEADRMRNLRFDDAEIDLERDVVLEERRMSSDGNPGEIVEEAMTAAIFAGHPYGRPVIGWQHEIETLGRDEVRAFYHRFYSPENAILIVTGDVVPDAVLALADTSYGRIAPGTDPIVRRWPTLPAPLTHCRVSLREGRVRQPLYGRKHRVPSHVTAAPGEAPALELLAHLLGGGPTSLLYQALVRDQRIAVSVSATYFGAARAETTFSIDVVPAPGVSLEAIEAAVEAVIVRLGQDGPDPAALDRTRAWLAANTIFARDSAMAIGGLYGANLAIGRPPAAVDEWPFELERTQPDDLLRVLPLVSLARGTSGFLTGL